ncbi:hypothetical protein EVG20_g5152, partial [Dentipellis fragilis]
MAKKSTARSSKSAAVTSQTVSDAIQQALAPFFLLLEQQQAAIAALQSTTDAIRQTSDDNQHHLRAIHQGLVDGGLASQRGFADTAAAAGSSAPSVTVSSPSPSPPRQQASPTLSAP